MGCGASRTQNESDQDLFNEAYGQQNRKIDGLKVDEVKIETHKVLNGIFMEEILEHGDEFGSVKPFLANIIPPSKPPQENKKIPEIKLEMAFVFGYRCHDVRQNLFWMDSNTIIYISAALGIVHEIYEHTQKFLGGYESKSDSNCHDDDIISIDYISCPVQMVATGQRGIKPKILVWSPNDPKIIYSTLFQTKGTKEISCLGFNMSGSHLASVGKDAKKSFFVFNIHSKECIWTDQLGSDIMFDLKFSNKDENSFCMAGINNIYFANFKEKRVRKGNYVDFKPTNHTCIQFLNDGSCITATSIGLIYFWNNSYNCFKTLKVSEFPLHSLKFSSYTNKIYTGDSKSMLYILLDFKICNTFEMTSNVRAIDINSEFELIIGLREGDIIFKDLECNENETINRSHHDGQIWGLEYIPDKYVLTTGDDNKIMLWDLSNYDCIVNGIINKIPAIKSIIKGSSGITEYPANQCARAVTYNPYKDHVVIGICDGSISIRSGLLNLNENEKAIPDIELTNEWIEVMKFSPDNKHLAVGAHDKIIYILNVDDNYSKERTLRDHSSFIKCIDWDFESEYIQSVCGNREFLFFKIDEGKQIRKVLDLRDVNWSNFTCIYGWPVQGIFMGSNNPDFINSVYRSNSNKFLISGDEEKKVNIYNYPCIRDKPLVKRYQAHSEAVNRVVFNHNDTIAVSAGRDKCLIVWKIINDI